jgi:hypothetical protein
MPQPEVPFEAVEGWSGPAHYDDPERGAGWLAHNDRSVEPRAERFFEADSSAAGGARAPGCGGVREGGPQSEHETSTAIKRTTCRPNQIRVTEVDEDAPMTQHPSLDATLRLTYARWGTLRHEHASCDTSGLSARPWKDEVCKRKEPRKL